MRRHVVIWGDDHHNALGLLRMLGGRDFDVLLIVSERTNIATSSKYCTRSTEIPDLIDGIQYLIKNYTDMNNKAVLLLTADKYAEIVNKNLSELNKRFYISGILEEGALAKINDKYYMGKLAEDCGFLVPKTVLVSANNCADIDEFPVIVKPCLPVSKDFKTLIIKNRKELGHLHKWLYPEKKYVLQQYIQKKADCLVYGCRTISGKTIIAGACIRSRWSDDGCGSFGYITSELPKGVHVTEIADFLSRIDYYGLFSVEYGLTDDKAYFYEFNLRNDGTSQLFYQAGANIALAFVNSCFGKETTSEPVQVNGKKYLINEFWDKYNVCDGVISRKQYENDYNRAELFFFYDPDDMEPYNIQKIQNIRRDIRRVLSKTWANKLRLQIKCKIRRKKKSNEGNNKR